MFIYLLTCASELVHSYQNKRRDIHQLATLLSDSASTTNAPNIIEQQISSLLDEDPNIQGILFYSTTYLLSDSNQANTESIVNDWQNALFASTVSFNYAVTKTDNRQKSARGGAIAPTSSNNTLIGYINITLDAQKLRLTWLKNHALLWLINLGLGLICAWLALRKIISPAKEMVALATVCDTVANNLELKQLPFMPRQFQLSELRSVRSALITLFNRLHAAESKHSELTGLEEQLHSKSLSLDIQRSNFQSMISHELKTSLNAIAGGLQLLNTQTLNEEQQDILAIIRQGSEHLDNTLEQIIQLNKIEKGQIGISVNEFNPLQLLSDVIADFEPSARQKGLELISRVQHVDSILKGDVDKIKQILSALIDNAIKFTLTGHVIIESQLDYFTDSIRWQIKVTDTGIGIDTKYLEDIFTPFFQVDPSHTREYAGLGLGLSLVKQFAQLIDASIEVKSNPDMGAEFILTLPLRNTYQGQHQNLLRDKKIIYIYHQNVDFMVKELEMFGASVSCQQYGVVAIEQLIMTPVDMIMIAEDVLPEAVAQLARDIREQEDAHRALLIYWYPLHSLVSIEYGLQALGVDFCHLATRDRSELVALFKKWLSLQ